MSSKRIVIQTLDGLRKIVGQADEDTIDFHDHIDDCDLGGRSGTVHLVKVAPKYVLYREAE